MKKALSLLICGMTVTMITNCTSTDLKVLSAEMSSEQKTVVKLDKNNYQLIGSRISGESEGLHILPLFRTKGGFTYRETMEEAARKKMYENSGNLNGRPIVFINAVKEECGKNYFIFSRPKIRITADLIEFTK